MRRTKSKSPFEELAEAIGRLLPWWLCIGLGFVCFLVLHAYAARSISPVTSTHQMAGALTESMLRAGAMVGQYALPLLFGFAAVVSFIVRRQRQQLVARATGSNPAAAVAAMSWQQFEQLIGQAFRQRGYRVTERGGGGPDGGVDLVLHRGREKFLVQAKHWKAFKVGVDCVRSLYGVMAAEGAAGGFVVTSGKFTQDAATFAAGRNVELVDGEKLLRLIQDATVQPESTDHANVRLAAGPPPEVVPGQTGAVVPPSCPVCSRPMQLKTARRGSNAGNSFWGCPSFTSGCRGTRPI